MTKTRNAVTRRTVLEGAGAAALVGAAKSLFPSGAYAQESGPETTKAILGFIALTDAAPLFVAKEKGFFDKYGMTDVEVVKQASWGTTRDNIVLGSGADGIDGGHILTPMPYLITAGTVTQNNIPTPMSILARLNLGGQCISVGQEYIDLKIGLDTVPFKAALEAKKATGKSVSAAQTFPGGTHDLWIRYWMAAGGIDPDSDINTIVVPPAQMVANMKVGTMDCFCVCEPWNEQLKNQQIGYTALTTSELWYDHPEKAFALRTDYVEQNPRATKALLMAIMEAQMWCQAVENREEVARICSRRNWINAPFNDIIERVKGNFDYGTGRVEMNSRYAMKYWDNNASYPYRSHDKWFLTENIRWGKLPADMDMDALIEQVNREDIWRDAAATLGVTDIPTLTSRGPETFFDGKVFDPEDPETYLNSLTISRMTA